MRSASGAQVAFASENATTSACVARTAASCAATLPPRGFRITRRPGSLGELLGAVGGGIGGDDELEQLGRIVERAEVLEPPLDRALLVVRRHDHSDGRQVGVVERDPPRTNARRERDGHGIQRVRPGERGKRAPEEDDGRDHGANASGVGRAARWL